MALSNPLPLVFKAVKLLSFLSPEDFGILGKYYSMLSNLGVYFLLSIL
jgi:hypothetical protein